MSSWPSTTAPCRTTSHSECRRAIGHASCPTTRTHSRQSQSAPTMEITACALGGSLPRPGAASLAHREILAQAAVAPVGSSDHEPSRGTQETLREGTYPGTSNTGNKHHVQKGGASERPHLKSTSVCPPSTLSPWGSYSPFHELSAKHSLDSCTFPHADQISFGSSASRIALSRQDAFV